MGAASSSRSGARAASGSGGPGRLGGLGRLGRLGGSATDAGHLGLARLVTVVIVAIVEEAGRARSSPEQGPFASRCGKCNTETLPARRRIIRRRRLSLSLCYRRSRSLCLCSRRRRRRYRRYSRLRLRMRSGYRLAIGLQRQSQRLRLAFRPPLRHVVRGTVHGTSESPPKERLGGVQRTHGGYTCAKRNRKYKTQTQKRTLQISLYHATKPHRTW